MIFLSGPLWLPFQEPRFLLHGEDVDFAAGPCFKQESRDENLKLAKLWDTKGLVGACGLPLSEWHVFACFQCPQVSDARQADR